MFFRMSSRLFACKCIWQDVLPSIKKVPFLQQSFYSLTSTNSKQDGVLQAIASAESKDLLKKARKEDRVAPKVKPIGLYPPKTTKTARIFETMAVTLPNEEGFNKAIEEFQKKDLKRLKLIDFIPTAVSYMDQFGVSKNLDIYNKLLDTFPRGRYHDRSVFDTLWTRYRPQIDTAVHLLTKMEENGVRPNVDTYDIVEAVFRNNSIPMNKLKRIVFWFDKFDEMYPHPLPKDLPTNKLELFTLAIQRMFGDTVPIIEYKTSTEHPSIVGTYSSNIHQQLEECDETKPLFVEGPFYVWLKKNQLFYYVLQVDVTLDSEDSIIAVCFIGNDDGGKEELKKWLNELQKEFPRLENLNVIFSISNNQTVSQ